MTKEEYNQLDIHFAHCASNQCKKANKCLRNIAHSMLVHNRHDFYSVINPSVIKGDQPCPHFISDHRETFAWGISHIYDKVQVTDLDNIRKNIIYNFGKSIYYRIKQQKRAITEDEQQTIRNEFTEMGYDVNAIEFDRYEEKYPILMQLYKYN